MVWYAIAIVIVAAFTLLLFIGVLANHAVYMERFERGKHIMRITAMVVLVLAAHEMSKIILQGSRESSMGVVDWNTLCVCDRCGEAHYKRVKHGS